MRRVLSSLFILSLSIFAVNRAAFADAITPLDPLYTTSEVKPKNADSWPSDIDQNIVEPIDADRDVASVTKWKKNSKKRPVPKAKPKASPVLRSATRQPSHLPPGARNGFEIRVKTGGIATTFLVSQRGLRQDLLYANSGGSRAAIALSPENFRVLQEHAVKIPISTTSLRACPKNNMQIQIVSNGMIRTSSFCVNAKSDGAEKLRNLGNTLVVWVR